MQIVIDTKVDGVNEIRAAIALLTTLAAVMPPDSGFPFAPAPLPVIPPPPPIDNHPPFGQSVFIPPPPPPTGAAPLSSTDPTAVFANGGIPNTVPAPPSVPPSASPSDLDSSGLPHDARIHSDAKKRNADGTWRFRRNLDDAVKSATIAELRARYPQAAPAVPPPPPMVAVPPAVQTPGIPAPPDAAAQNPAMAGATVIPPPPPTVGAVSPGVAVAVPAGPVTDFKSLMAKAGALMQSGRLNHPQLAQACAAAGVASLPALMQQTDKIPAVDAWLNANVPQ